MDLADTRLAAVRTRCGSARWESAYLVVLLPLAVALWLLADFTWGISPEPAMETAVLRQRIANVGVPRQSHVQPFHAIGSALDGERDPDIGLAFFGPGQVRTSPTLRRAAEAGALLQPRIQHPEP